MRIRFFSLFLVSVLFLQSCSNEFEQPTALLTQVIDFYSDLERGEVIACAAGKENDVFTTYIYYYPPPGATDIKYFETNSEHVISTNFGNYHEIEYPQEDVFGGYLKRFVRDRSHEAFGIVTFVNDGKFHISNPIKLKNRTRPTEYRDAVSIDQTQSLLPKFSWNDGTFTDNVIYFQVITDVNNNFLSGTYTTQRNFQYNNFSNVVLDINRETPPDLIANDDYNFSMLAVSEDNWVNLIIEKPFTAQ